MEVTDFTAGNSFAFKTMENFDSEFLKAINNTKINSITVMQTMILWLAVDTDWNGYAFPITDIDNYGFWVEVPETYDYHQQNYRKITNHYFEFENLQKINKEN